MTLADEETSDRAPSREWNEYQNAVFEAVGDTEYHLIIQARAGTGKTTTIVEALQYIPPFKRTLLCAFNKSIQLELQSRAPAGVDVKTLHGIGFGCLRRGRKIEVDENKTYNLIKEVVGKKPDYERVARLKRLVSLSKNTLAPDTEAIAELAHRFCIEDEEHPAGQLADQATTVLEKCLEDTTRIDFDDMIWMPIMLDATPSTYDLVFVDEAQDLNAAQRWLVEQMVRDGGRLVAVGDDRQAIYGWRGAGHDVLRALERQFEARVLPLSITYRCPKKIVAQANHIVPDYKAAPNAPDGTIIDMPFAKMVAEAKPGDFVLSRSNAPLMKVCLELLKKGTPATITGRDIGKTLANLAKKAETNDIKAMLTWGEQHLAKERVRLLPEHEDQYEQIVDKVEALFHLAEGMNTVDELVRRIESLFSDDDDRHRVTCSTVHRAKGLERDRVWMLRWTFRPGNNREEDNIFYVGITRAREALYMVQQP